MLSIGKLATGQARYYLGQAEGRVDAVQSIGDGIEDYYAGGAEARGEWRVVRRRGPWVSTDRSMAMRFGTYWRAIALGLTRLCATRARVAGFCARLGTLGSRAAALAGPAVSGRAGMRPLRLAGLSRRQALALLGLLPGSSLLGGKARAEATTVRKTLRVALP